MGSFEGLVMRSTGSWYEVRPKGTDEIVRCRLKGKFKIKDLKVTNPIAVGDWVRYDCEGGQSKEGIIDEIRPRKNYMVRKSVHKTGHSHLLASNVDQAILMVTLVFPRTSLGFIDRFLVTAEAFRIPAVLIFNKQDILDEEVLDMQRQLTDLYERLGYRCHLLTAVTGEGLDAFKVLLNGKISILSGHSGVGKTTLLNSLVPELALRTNEVSTYANKGVHTTTFAEMFEVAPETFLIDSPGIKELGLADIEPQEISHYFPEMRDRLNACRFHDCMHLNEPGCAVKEAVTQGEISFTRYESYLSMVGNQDNRK